MVQRFTTAALLCCLTISFNNVSANHVIAKTEPKTAQSNVRFSALISPVIDVHPFGTNNTLNLAQASTALSFSGRTQVNGVGQSVKLKIDGGGTEYSGTVDNAGNWSVTLPPYALNSLNNGSHTVTVTATDALNNTANVDKSFTSGLTPPILTLNTPFSDGYLSVTEASIVAGRTLSGTAANTTSITATFGGQALVTQLSGGVWTATLTPTQLGQLADGIHNIEITAVDIFNNITQLKSQAILSVKNTPTVTITAFAGLDGLNFAESRNIQVVSGTSVNLEVGSTVQVGLNSKNYQAKVLANGTWTTSIPSADLQALANTSYVISARATDRAGNVTTQATTAFSVNLTPPPIAMVIDPIAGDNIINASEINGNVTISGRSIGPASAFTAVSVNIGSTPLVVVTDVNGFWSTTVPAAVYFFSQGNINVTATSLDATLTRTVLVETTAPTLSIGSFAADNTLNASEITIAQTITGTAATSASGQLVVLQLNGKTYYAQVSATGNWSASVPAADLAQLPIGSSTITATLASTAGNTTTDTQIISKDTTKPTVVLASTAGSATVTSPIAFTATFSEAVANFIGNNISIINGLLLDFSANGNTYNFTVLPTTYGNVSVYISEGATIDLAGNDNVGATALTVNYIDAALPVELLSFTAKTEGNAVRLNWSTQSESNNNTFTLLRSNDQLNFKPIATLNGQGTTQTITNYTYLDRSPLAGTNYYQLVQTDFNGQPKPIAVRAVAFELGTVNEITLYPNPATSLVSLKFNEPTSKIELIDLNGRTLERAKITAEATAHSFNVAALPAGTYFIKLYQQTGQKTLKFIKL